MNWREWWERRSRRRFLEGMVKFSLKTGNYFVAKLWLDDLLELRDSP